MFTRIASLSLTVAALTFSAALAADKSAPTPANTMSGSIISAQDGKVTILGKNGKSETTFKITKELKVICNGKKCALKDLREGVPVTVQFKTDADKVLWATKITAENQRQEK